MAEAASPLSGRHRDVLALGSAQTLAWASSYYLPAMLAGGMARDLGLSTSTVFAGFSLALVVSALVGPTAGRWIDQRGGRPVLMLSNLVFALGLCGLAGSSGLTSLLLAWAVIGLAMGGGLYEAAFAALVRLRLHQAREAITGITLIAGFASTVGWPLTAWLEHRFGWRGACLVWAGLHLLLALPLNASLPRAMPLRVPAGPGALPASTRNEAGPGGEAPAFVPTARPVLASCLLAFVFAVAMFTSTAMATHLPALLQAGGVSLTMAVAAGALVGPAQVLGRLAEYGVMRRVHPLLSARLAVLTHPLGALALVLVGLMTPAAALGPAMFAVLHGLGNGILTIAKGSLPLVFFGPLGYGARQGWLMMPARVAQAVAPLGFGLALAHWGMAALWLSAGLGMAGLVALMLMPPAPLPPR